MCLDAEMERHLASYFLLGIKLLKVLLGAEGQSAEATLQQKI